jgi:hypothetical protein
MGPARVTSIRMPRLLNPTRKRNLVRNRSTGAPRVLATYKVVPRLDGWVTGDRATQTKEEIERDILEHYSRALLEKEIQDKWGHTGTAQGQQACSRCGGRDILEHCWKKRFRTSGGTLAQRRDSRLVRDAEGGGR